MCGAEIWFVKTKKGKYIPVDDDPEGETEFDRERMRCHFDSCPDAEKFRKS